MSGSVSLLFDEHVSRVFEGVLRERGYQAIQAKDRFGEHTTDEELLRWCGENGALLLSNNVRDFEPLHRDVDHAGLLLYYEQSLPGEDPESLARTVEAVVEQYGTDELTNSLVDLCEWYDWLHE